MNCMMKAGMTIEMIDGMVISHITPRAVMRPLFHSMMVVTSPMGEKAPPELAAMMTSEAYMMRSLWSLTSFRKIIIITMLVVRLSRMAERMNVMKAMRHSSVRLLLVFITPRTQLNPPFWSTISTMVMAPMRKKRVVEVSPRCSCMMDVIFSIICWWSAAAKSGCMSCRNCDGSNM